MGFELNRSVAAYSWISWIGRGILRIILRKIGPDARNSLKFLDFEWTLPLIHQLYLGRSKRVEAWSRSFWQVCSISGRKSGQKSSSLRKCAAWLKSIIFMKNMKSYGELRSGHLNA
jgi:hypothetical protein